VTFVDAIERTHNNVNWISKWHKQLEDKDCIWKQNSPGHLSFKHWKSSVRTRIQQWGATSWIYL